MIESFEKGIHNDFKRVHSKGKTLADIPKKEKIWYFSFYFNKL